MFHQLMSAATKITVTASKIVLGMVLGLITVVGIIFASALK